MKKVILIFGMIILLTGCSTSKKLNLETIGEKILKTSEFKNHEISSINTLTSRYGLKNIDSDEVLLITPLSFDDSKMVLIILPKNDDKRVIDEIKNSYENQWIEFNYFPEEKELVENALYELYGNYIIYIVSKDNNEILKLIKE